MRTIWLYDGYTKVRVGKGKLQHYHELHNWKCKECGHIIKGGKITPWFECPVCEGLWNGGDAGG